MSVIARWAFRCGLFFLVATLALDITLALRGVDAASVIRADAFATRAGGLCLQVTIVMGIVLLVEAFLWLKRHWGQLSTAAKVTSIVGLAMTSIFGAYVFHFLIPSLERGSRRH